MKSLFTRIIFFSFILISIAHSETIQEQYNATNESTIQSLTLLNRNFFDHLQNNIQCTVDNPKLINESDYNIEIEVNYHCLFKPFDVVGLKGFQAIKGNEFIDIKEDGSTKFSEKIIDEYFNKIYRNYVVYIGLKGTNYVKQYPFFTTYTENVRNILVACGSTEDTIRFEVPKSEMNTIKDAFVKVAWKNGTPDEILNNMGYLTNEEIAKQINNKIKSSIQTFNTVHLCASKSEVKNFIDMSTCSMGVMIQTMGGENKYEEYSKGKKMIFPLKQKDLEAKFKKHTICLQNLATRRFKNSKELDDTITKECPIIATELLIQAKK